MQTPRELYSDGIGDTTFAGSYPPGYVEDYSVRPPLECGFGAMTTTSYLLPPFYAPKNVGNRVDGPSQTGRIAPLTNC